MKAMAALTLPTFICHVIGGKEAVGGSQLNNSDSFNDATDCFLNSRGLGTFCTSIELSLSASKLLDRDVLSKSDPMAVLYTKNNAGIEEEIGRTEVILNSLNPNWITKIKVDYKFETVQRLIFRVYDVDSKYHNTPVKTLKLKEQDFLGEVFCALSEIITKPSQTVNLKLKADCCSANQNLGTITVHAEEVVASKRVVKINFRCSKLKNTDTFSKSDPFLRISRIVENGNYVPIYKTEVINDNLNPSWKTVILTTRHFGSKDTPLLIECLDFNSNGDHTLLGQFQGSVANLEKLNLERTGASLYISTSSNQNNKKAISRVGEVVQFYDTDKQFPAWGFGGRLPGGEVSHCFNLNGSSDEKVSGVEGILRAYATSLHTVTLHGPTLFAPVITQAANIASECLAYNKNKYFVLLIITDGVINDFTATKDALVRAADLPFSVLIVGVGNADFTEMQILDGDGKRLQSTSGKIAARDIVQFVPMRELQGEISIAQALLEELPGQFLSYMSQRDIKPLYAQHGLTPY